MSRARRGRKARSIGKVPNLAIGELLVTHIVVWSGDFVITELDSSATFDNRYTSHR